MVIMVPSVLFRCGVARLGVFSVTGVEKFAPFMPSGSKIRRWTNASQLLFEASPTA
jgi:hypothetical protein